VVRVAMSMVLLAGAFCGVAQQRVPGQPEGMVPVSAEEAKAVLEKAAATHPKFTAQLADAREHDTLLKDMHWVRGQRRDRGPAFASPMGFVTVDLNYLDKAKPGFDDNRMVVVLYHEIGHLHYYVNTPRPEWTPENSEKAAFEYSLKVTKELAEKGDCGPLATGVYFMKRRSEGTNLQDPHVRALKRMVNEPMYAGYVQDVKAIPACKDVKLGYGVGTVE